MKIIGYLILCALVTVHICIGSRSVFKDKKPFTVIGTGIVVLGILFGSVMVARFALNLIC